MLEFFLFLIFGLGYGFYFDLNLLETALVGLLLSLAFRGWIPRIALPKSVIRFAHCRKMAVAAVFLLALSLRAILLPVLPLHSPQIPDEFSHLLLADTLVQGRLTNPTHPEWVHFESLHIIQQPTYNSDYFPGQASTLALGMLLGHPWIGVWLLCAVMCATLCWMLQAWVSPVWALFGAVIAVIRFGIASYWINNYQGGCLAAIGGALVMGALPRLIRKPNWWTSLLLGLGLTIIVYARPFEGLAVAVPAALVAAIAIWKRRLSIWRMIPAVVIVALGFAGLLLYNKAVTGDPSRTPYAVNQATYGWPMTLPWFHPTPHNFQHVELRRYYDYERETHDRSASILGELKFSTIKFQEIWRFYFGPALSIALVMLAAVWRSRRIRLPILVAAMTLLLSLIETGTSPHYSAAGTACFLAILVECFRQLRKSKVGAQLAATVPAILLIILATRIGLEAAHLPFTQRVNFQSWCCVQPGNPNKARITAQLERLGGQHLVLVTPKSDEDNLLQWIYNRADIDGSNIVWARDMGAEGNRTLLEYFKTRRVWLVDPNVEPATITASGP